MANENSAQAISKANSLYKAPYLKGLTAKFACQPELSNNQHFENSVVVITGDFTLGWVVWDLCCRCGENVSRDWGRTRTTLHMDLLHSSSYPSKRQFTLTAHAAARLHRVASEKNKEYAARGPSAFVIVAREKKFRLDCTRCRAIASRGF